MTKAQAICTLLVLDSGNTKLAGKGLCWEILAAAFMGATGRSSRESCHIAHIFKQIEFAQNMFEVMVFPKDPSSRSPFGSKASA